MVNVSFVKGQAPVVVTVKPPPDTRMTFVRQQQGVREGLLDRIRRLAAEDEKRRTHPMSTSACRVP